MTCYHVILGRPWQASRNTIHFGSSNVYIVHKDGVKFKLNPFTGHDEERVICFGKKEFVGLQEQRESKHDITNLPLKPSLLVMKDEIVQHKTQNSAYKQTMTAKGVMIGIVWCPLVMRVKK